jgi:hypothetical protein
MGHEFFTVGIWIYSQYTVKSGSVGEGVKHLEFLKLIWGFQNVAKFEDLCTRPMKVNPSCMLELHRESSYTTT